MTRQHLSAASLGLAGSASHRQAAEPGTPPAELPARVHLTLLRRAGGPGWQAELHIPGAPRSFDSMTELMAWLGTLDGPPSPCAPPLRGIR